MRISFALLLLVLCTMPLLGCRGTFPPDTIDPSGHLSRADYAALRERGSDAHDTNKDGPPIPDLPPLAPPPLATLTQDDEPSYDPLVSVSVTERMPLRAVLQELGREGGINLELDPRIQGGVIFHAKDQPFRDVLKRICRLAGLRWRQDGAFIRVELDEPYEQSYALDYLSLTRHASSEVTIATNVFDVDVGANGNGSTGGSANGSNGGSDNNSLARISGSSDTDFWAELSRSLAALLAATPAPLVGGGGAAAQTATADTATHFTIDRQAGLVTVIGTERQQEVVGAYLNRLRRKATAQVLIEARIVEVELNDSFKSGINWRTLFDRGVNVAGRFGTVGAGAPFVAATTAADGVFTASLDTQDFSSILNLVRGFGTTRILSSPRLSVLNNQTAVMKVARNEVYFLTTAQFPTTVSTGGVAVTGNPVFSSTPRTVPVGLVMTVQPAIDAEHGRVTMTLRPTISRVVGRVSDPSIGLNAARAGVTTPVESLVPVLAVREMDSVVQLRSGDVAVMGGLMQDSSINSEQGVPPFDDLPVVGNLAKSRDNAGATSELVILLRATILDTPAPDATDTNLYTTYGRDPRPLSLPPA